MYQSFNHLFLNLNFYILNHLFSVIKLKSYFFIYFNINYIMNKEDKKEEDKKQIINFALIAHVDAGKTSVSKQILKLFGLKKDKFDVLAEEQSRNITIKAKTIRIETAKMIFNIIDTPGHMDFIGQVDSFLQAAENSVLLLDGTKGLQSQTFSKIFKSKEKNNFILTVINKIDLHNLSIEKCIKDMQRIGLNTDHLCLVSGKTGEGIDTIIKALIEFGKTTIDLDDKDLKILIIDSFFNQYYGIVLIVKVVEGVLNTNEDLYLYKNKYKIKAHEIGFFKEDFEKQTTMRSGEIGYIITKIKNPEIIENGDTIVRNLNITPLPFLVNKKCQVFCFFLLEDQSQYDLAYEALEKVKLTDSSFTIEKKETVYNGRGFRCGFLGILHLEIIQSRIFNEFGISLIATFPLVEYKIEDKKGNITFISDPNLMPNNIFKTYEPECICTIYTESKYIGNIIEVCNEKRATNIQIQQNENIIITCQIPLNEIITNFSDKLQSVSNGYCNYDYQESGYREVNLSVSSVWINQKIVSELTYFSIKDNQVNFASNLAEKLKENIHREQFEIVIQVKSGLNGKIIASRSLSPIKKNVISHCSGGDFSRKKKLIEEQNEGKKRLMGIGNVKLPAEAFFKIVRL